MNILMVSSEVFPYAKSGGLADVLPKLAEALDKRGHRVKIVMPRYYGITRYLLDKHPAPLGIPMGDQEYWVGVYSTLIPGTRVEVYFLDHEQLFGRDGIYSEAGGPEFPDNVLRFGLLSRGAFQLAKMLNWFPDILQAHDWPAAPALAYLKSLESAGPFRKTKGVFTIHNLGYQGIFSQDQFKYLGLDPSDETRLGFSYHGGINFLQAALVCAHGISTVSPGYGEEILQPELGFAMDGLLNLKKNVLAGILNGMDYDIWNPKTDQLLPFLYDENNLEGKAKNKAALQELAGFSQTPGVPLIGMVSRLVTQKGFAHLVENDGEALRKICALPAQIIILGTGEKHIEKKLSDLALELPHLQVFIRYNEKTSHLIEAGSDFFLMPSLYEPCGLTQMYALSYGTIPIVSPTGGLKDTVVDRGKNPKTATGYYFPIPLTGTGMVETLAKATKVYRLQPKVHRAMILRGMALRFDWESAGRHYEEYFLSLP